MDNPLGLRKPRRLRPGDTACAVTLSWGGPGAMPQRYQAGKRQFEQTFGVRVVESRHALRDPGWVAANPKARAADLMEAFADPTVSAVISTIGGDDSVRILPHLDLAVFRENPKVFLGYSDTTVTHFACLRAGLVSFYGPSFMSGFGENGGIFPYTVDSVRRTLFSPDPIGTVPENRDGWTVEFLDWADPANQLRPRRLNASTGWRFLQGRGAVTGHLLGGCADVLEFLKGTAWWPAPDAWRGAILFLETSEVAVPPWQFRSWLRNDGTQGILQSLAGLIVGRPGGHRVPPSSFADYDAAILQVVSNELGLTSLPVVTQMDFGHTDPMFVLPIGLSATIDCDGRAFSVNENAVV